jgi:YggT family protein
VPARWGVKQACAKRTAALHDPQQQGRFMSPVIWLIYYILNLFFWLIIAVVVLSWLVAFNVVNGSNPYVRQISYALRRLTEPVLGPVRRLLPDLGGIDISPIIVLIALQFLQYSVVYYGSRLF